MKIKKFKARNFTEALKMVKKELSEDAIILSTEEKKGLRPSVEVTAAVDYDGDDRMPGHQADAAWSKAYQQTMQLHAKAPAVTREKGRIPRKNEAMMLRGEIRTLRSIVQEMKNSGYEISLPVKKKAVFHHLREMAIRDEYALRLCDKTVNLQDITSMISSEIQTPVRHSEKRVVMLAGPTGVGKTTTVAKLAANAMREKKRVALINLDTYRIGAVEQIRIYSKIMGIPLAVVSNADELGESLSKYLEDRDCIFIDTTGRNPRDESHVDFLVEVCHKAWSASGSQRYAVPFELHLLMSASSDDSYMIEASSLYKRLPVTCIGFTKIDEAVRFGSLYNLLLTYQRPVAYITTGQKVPDDIDFITADRLAQLIVQKGYHTC